MSTVDERPRTAAPPPDERRAMVTSYLNLRRGVGIIGTALPIVLVVGNDIAARRIELERSISGYYYTDMRNVLVGAMCATGVFLLSYRYGRVDNRLAVLAGACAVGVGLFPTRPDHPTTAQRLIGLAHLSFAAVFFAALAGFCLFLFTRSDRAPDAQTRRKRLRNRVYRICGGLIAACLAIVVVTEIVLPLSVRNRYHPAFWGESLAIVAFGVAWFVKGETILKDQTPR